MEDLQRQLKNWETGQLENWRGSSSRSASRSR